MNSDLTPKIGIIFDLDGTLLDSTDLIFQIPDVLKKKYNVSIDQKTSDEIEGVIVNALKGRSGKFLIIRLTLYVAKRYKIPWYLRLRYLRDAGELYKKLIKTVPIFPGAKETIEFLINQGCRVAINTTSSRTELLDRFEHRMGFLDMFCEYIVTRTDIKKMKPHPESIQILSERMGIPIKKLVMVGDMDADVLAGINSGCTTVGVLTGYASRKMMEDYNHDFIIESVKDFPNLLPKLLEKIDSL
jgi:phosphoglycolate phosphatase-like HAD superfamily hydrolase